MLRTKHFYIANRHNANIPLDNFPACQQHIFLPGRVGNAGHTHNARGIAKNTITLPASLVILNRLTDVLFFCALREWLSRSFAEGGALAALSDQRLQRALSAIHDSPDRNWTIENLAQVAGQSRTAFAQGFRQAMATTPMGYVTRYRTLLARRMLTETSLALDDIASRTGYSDTNAFSRAFRRVIGTSPGALRKSSRN